jgi:hypothetical protein
MIQEPRSDVPCIPVKETTSDSFTTNDIHIHYKLGLRRLTRIFPWVQAQGLPVGEDPLSLAGTPGTTYTMRDIIMTRTEMSKIAF